MWTRFLFCASSTELNLYRWSGTCPSQNINVHFHNFPLLIVIDKKKIKILTKGLAYGMAPGEILFTCGSAAAIGLFGLRSAGGKWGWWGWGAWWGNGGGAGLEPAAAAPLPPGAPPGYPYPPVDDVSKYLLTSSTLTLSVYIQHRAQFSPRYSIICSQVDCRVGKNLRITKPKTTKWGHVWPRRRFKKWVSVVWATFSQLGFQRIGEMNS